MTWVEIAKAASLVIGICIISYGFSVSVGKGGALLIILGGLVLMLYRKLCGFV